MIRLPGIWGSSSSKSGLSMAWRSCRWTSATATAWATRTAAIFALVDMTFATVSNAAGLYCVNAQTNISYLEPGRIGPLRGEARKIRSGRNLGTYDVRITDSDGTLVAIATVTGFMTKYPIQQKDA